MPGYGQWSKREQIAGVEVVRLRHYVPRRPSGLKRAWSEISFGLRLAFSDWESPDAVVVVSPALLSTSVAMLRLRVTKRATPVVVWVQDLYSLGLSETGQGHGAVVNVMKRIEGWVLRHADRVVVIHDRFAGRVVAEYGVSPDRVEVVHNWTHIAGDGRIDVAAERIKYGWAPNETVVLHAGNMGVKQGLENVVEAARLADSQEAAVRFVLVGSGSEHAKLLAMGNSIARLDFLDSLPDEDFTNILRAADILLVNEKPGVAEMAVPSKLTSYFDAGRPVLASTDPTGITAEEVAEAAAGVVVRAGDPSALLGAAIMLGEDRHRAEELGANGMRYRQSVLDEEKAIDKFAGIVISTLPGGSEIVPHRRPTERSSKWPNAPS